jgi:hypothetical protein
MMARRFMLFLTDTPPIDQLLRLHYVHFTHIDEINRLALEMNAFVLANPLSGLDTLEIAGIAQGAT